MGKENNVEEEKDAAGEDSAEERDTEEEQDDRSEASLSAEALKNSRVGIYIEENVFDQRLSDEMLEQIEHLSPEELRILNALQPREFAEVVQGAIFDAGEKVKFWERFDEYDRRGRRVLAKVSAKRRELIRRMLMRDLAYPQYKLLNQLSDSLFISSLEALLSRVEAEGSQRLDPSNLEEIIAAEAEAARYS